MENWQITGELVTDRMIGGVTIDVSAKVWRLDIIRKGERGRLAVLPSIFKFDGDALVWVTEFPGDGWYQQVPCEYLQTTPPK